MEHTTGRAVMPELSALFDEQMELLKRKNEYYKAKIDQDKGEQRKYFEPKFEENKRKLLELEASLGHKLEENRKYLDGKLEDVAFQCMRSARALENKL